MPTTPPATAAQNGFPSDPDAVNASAQVNQFLGTHGITPVYGGNQILTPAGASSGTQTQFFWITPTAAPSIPNFGLLTSDFDQPFTMPTGQTAIGRVELALLPAGDGADVQVTLCPDNGAGAPNTAIPLASTVVPAPWITNLAAPDGLAAGGPLAVPRHNALLGTVPASHAWSQPAIGPNGAGTHATAATSGNYVILLGGYDTVAGAASNNVATVQYLGDQTLSGPSPQPSLPQAAWYGMAIATDSMVMFAGGTNGSTFFANVWTASWDPNTGTVGAWSAQAPLPVPSGATGVNQGAAASWGDTVYVIGGSTSGSASNALASVWYASAINGQIGAWLAAPPLPQPLQVMFAGVVGNWLIVTGGQTSTGTTNSATYYAPINPDGSLDGWRNGPALPTPAYAIGAQWSATTTDTSLIVFSGLESGTTYSPVTQILTATTDGIGTWQYQQLSIGDYQAAAFPSGTPGAWDLIGLQTDNYVAATMVPVPMLSVPLPASGLTPGATYHLLVHQIGGDLNNYTQVGELFSSQSWQYAIRGSGGPWTAHTQHALMFNVYDQTPTSRMPLHAWVDPNAENRAAEAATFVHDADGRLLGECSATAMITQPSEDPAYLPSVAQLVYPDDGGMPTGIIQLA